MIICPRYGKYQGLLDAQAVNIVPIAELAGLCLNSININLL